MKQPLLRFESKSIEAHRKVKPGDHYRNQTKKPKTTIAFDFSQKLQQSTNYLTKQFENNLPEDKVQKDALRR